MSSAELAIWLSKNRGFEEQVNTVTLLSARSEFPMAPSDLALVTPNWSYLLFCASILSRQSDEKCESMALRICIASLEDPTGSKAQKDASILILHQLTNHVSAILAMRRNLAEEDLENRGGRGVRHEILRSKLESWISPSHGPSIFANRFQSFLWKVAEANDWVSISAPTSAGKTFIVRKLVQEFAAKQSNLRIAFLAPSRALVEENERRFKEMFAIELGKSVQVSSIPALTKSVDGITNIFVFTQERMKILLNANDGSFRIDLLVVDEANRIGDRDRGILLQQVIEELVNANTKLRTYFISPLAKNPEELLTSAPSGASKATVIDNYISVCQNLIFANQVLGKKKLWNLDLKLSDRFERLGLLTLKNSPDVDSKRLPFVAHALGGNTGGNIIYVNGARAAEVAAEQLFALIVKPTELSTEISEFVELIHEVIHPEYLLAETIQRGVAFHYGNMPQIIRRYIESLFETGHIKYLVCTSTLLEGVNTPCRNIFLRNPKKGNSTPLTADSFWNLAGRAGRWGMEFQGNIICVDTAKAGVWKVPPPTVRARFPITKTTSHGLRNITKLLRFLREPDYKDDDSSEFSTEQIINYLSVRLLNGTFFKSEWPPETSDTELASLGDALESFISEANIPDEIIIRNPGISPHRMRRLIDHFTASNASIESLLPPDPDPEHADLYANHFSKLDEFLGADIGPNPKRYMSVAIITTRWLCGYSLRRIVDSKIYYLKQKHRYDGNAGDIILEVMRDIEKYARYTVPKYMSCYRDLLKHHLTKMGRDDLLSELKDYSLLLELGVSSKTQVSLIKLGFSRPVAVKISEIIPNTELEEDALKIALKDHPWKSSTIPAAMRREILEALKAF